MTNKPLYFDLITACEQPGCPVCNLVQKSTEHYLRSLFYEEVNDVWVRTDLRNSLGFCHEHAWLAAELEPGDALGLALIYHDIFSTILKALPAQDAARTSHRNISALFCRTPRGLPDRITATRRALAPKGVCPACKHRDQFTANVLSILVESLYEEAMMHSIASSNGLCLPHLAEAFSKVRKWEEHDQLLSLALRKFSGLNDELAEFIRKNDYRYISESFNKEGDAWRRAVAMMVGNKK
jgi:hypothetical protein